jgi:protein-tyrosine phosphatase
MIDIHCHILPEVDDGSQSLEHSLIMLQKQKNDGVTAIILTPHVQSRVQTVALEEHQEKFKHLKEKTKQRGIDIDLYLGAEVYYRSHLDPDYQTMSMNGSKYVLLEFAPAIPTPIEEVVYDLTRRGWIPIIAHVERYEYLSMDDYLGIKRSGGMLQMNALAAMNQDPKVRKGIVPKLLKNELIDFIATDSHNITTRVPNLKQAYDYLKSSLRPEYLEQIFFNNAKKLIE